MKIKTLFRAAMGGVLLSVTTGTSIGAGDIAKPVYTAANGIDAAAISRVVDPLFDDGDDAVSGETRAVIVMQDGRIVAERYAPGFDATSKMQSWSVAKTVTALLVGIMATDGRIALDAAVPVPAWRQGGDPRGAITLRQMLTMSSGIQHVENDPPIENSDTLRMLVGDGAADMARYAEAKPLAREPGSSFQYNSATTLILSDMMTRLLTDSGDPRIRRDAMAGFVQQRLMIPAGLPSLTPEFDAHGTMIGGAMMHMTARDYARLGEFLRREGRGADGRQVIPSRWIRFMTSSSAHNAGYGGHLWLNRPGAEHALFPGAAPASLYAATGLRGQFVIVSPAQRLTIVRLGVTSEAELPALKQRLLAIVRAFPAG